MPNKKLYIYARILQLFQRTNEGRTKRKKRLSSVQERPTANIPIVRSQTCLDNKRFTAQMKEYTKKKHH